ncbi:transglutaminase family protein [Candidatus Poribacteria bacterium]
MFLKACLIFGIALTLLLTTRWGNQDVLADEVKSVWTTNLPHESWMNATLMGVKVGRFHVYSDRAEYKGQSVIRVNSEFFTEIKRFGLSMKMTKTKLCYFRDDLSPWYFLSRSDETGQDKIVEGTVENGVIKITTTLGDRITESQQAIPPDTIFIESLEEMIVRRGLKVGDEYSLKVFNLDSLSTINVAVEVLRKENIEYDDETKEVFVTDYTLDFMGGITTRQWMSVDGEVYRMEMLSMMMDCVKVDRDEAMGSVGQLDLIVGTKIDLAGEHPDSGILRFKVKAILSEGEVLSTFVTDHRQTVHAGDNPGEGSIEVILINVNEEQAPRRPVNRPELSPYLSPSVYVESDDPDIIRKAQEVAGDEDNTWKAARKVCEWVNRSIKDKNYKVGFGTAKQTLKDLQGDCSEHTVLFVGLARSLGIPSRIATGLVYHKDAFYYHFWPEVYAGQWIAMEPTLGQIQADATHIKFVASPVETESALEFGEGVLKTMNKLKLERIE